MKTLPLSIALPRGRKCLVSLFAMALAFSGARATNYYVDSVAGSDSNTGTSTSAPWQTIPKVNGNVFLPGDQVLFKRGSVWTGRLTPKGSGTSSSQLVFGAYGTGAKPVINGGGGTQAIALWDNSYITIRDFEITNDAASDGIRDGIRITAQNSICRGIRILENDIHDVRGRSQRNGGLYDNAAIYIVTVDNGSMAGFDDLLVEGNNVYDITCIGLYTKPASYHSLYPELWTTNLVIRDNLFYDTGADHIVIGGATDPLVEYNAGYDAGINGQGYGYMAGMWTWKCDGATFQFNEVARTHNELALTNGGDSQAFDVDISTLGTHIFQYNYTHDNVGGILLTMPDPSENPLVKTIIYRYNLSVNDGRDTFSGSQFNLNPVFGVNSVLVYNNVFYSNLQEGFKVKDKQASYYYNNIFDVPAAIYPSLPTFSNNAYHRHTPDVNDPYKVVANPQFVGPVPTGAGADGYLAANTDKFKLQSTSPLINHGRTIANNGGRDFWNNPLYAGGYADIGMHEVVGGSNPPPGTVTFTDDAAGAVSYGGSWSHTADPLYYNSTKSASTTIGSSVQFTFSGTNIALYGKKGTGNGRLNIQIDGGTAILADCYWPEDITKAEIFRIGGLATGTHTILATITTKNGASSGNGIGIDYFQVLPGNPPVPPVVTTVDNPAGSSVSYSGSWTHPTNDANFYAKTRSNSSTVGSYVEFSFTGTGARLFGAKASSLGKLNVSIDGGAPTLVNCYNTTASDYLVKLYEVQGLSSGSHTLRATVATKDPDSTGSAVAIDFFQSLVGAVSANPIIVDNPASSVVTYSGTWNHATNDPIFYNSTKSTSKTIGSSVQFTFTGTGTSLYVKKGPNLGRLNLSIDGGPVTTVDCYSPTVVSQFKIHEYSGLNHGSHTLNAEIIWKSSASSDHWIGIDYFEYQP